MDDCFESGVRLSVDGTGDSRRAWGSEANSTFGDSMMKWGCSVDIEEDYKGEWRWKEAGSLGVVC